MIITKSELETIISERVNQAVSRLEERLAIMMEQQQPQQKERENYSIEDLCARWGVCKGSIHNYVKRGLLRGIKLGRRLIFPLDEILRAEANGVNRF